MAYLAETHNIWGPFLVVAPASTLHNWQQELTRFVPQLKAIPYWGNVKDWATLRKFWSKKEISYNQDASFYILVTSYQLVNIFLDAILVSLTLLVGHPGSAIFPTRQMALHDLDEAQNIKNSTSVQWKTLLGFQCRNKLLLTGTSIQNLMQGM